MRSPTLPPATHTNVWLVGDDKLSVFDPASPWEDEQDRLWTALMGRTIERIVLTHHHVDHVSGAVALAKRLERDGRPVPIVAHAANRGRVERMDEEWADGQIVACGGRRLQAVWTPGHAPGHLVFIDTDSSAVIAGDLVAGVGTIVLDTIDGDLAQYLDSLARVRARLPSVLLPAHGPALFDADAVLTRYISHRHHRTHQIGDALTRRGPSTALELATDIYVELDPVWLPIAAAQVTTHLRWMVVRGRAVGLAADLWGPPAAPPVS